MKEVKFGNSVDESVREELSLEQLMPEIADIQKRSESAQVAFVRNLRAALTSREKPARVPQEVFDWLLKEDILSQMLLNEDTSFYRQARTTNSFVASPDSNLPMRVCGLYLHDVKPEMFLSGEELTDFLRGEEYGRLSGEIFDYFEGSIPSERVLQVKPWTKPVKKDHHKARAVLEKVLKKFPLT